MSSLFAITLTCADRLVPAPLSVSLATTDGYVEAVGQSEARVTAHLQESGEGGAGREEAGLQMFTKGHRPGTRTTLGSGGFETDTMK